MALPPGPSQRVPGLLALAFSRDRLGLLKNLTRRYGDVVFFKAGGHPFAILNHPDYVRDVLVTRHRSFHKGVGLERARLLLGQGLLTSEDDVHLRQRRLLQPAFHRQRIAAYAATMVDYTRRHTERWRDGAVLDVAVEMSQLTLAIAGKTLFAADVEGEASEIGTAVTAAVRSFNFALLPYGDRLVRMPIPPAIRFRRARARLDATMYRLIAERRASGATGEDLLSVLVAARDEENEGRGMSDEQIRDEAMTLFLAGHETTANALAWTWYLLSEHPHVEQTMAEEVASVLNGRVASPDDLPRLPYTRAVFAESMRLFPPAFLVGRRALAAYAVPGTSYVLPPRTVVFLSQFLLHRDARFWDSPEAFDPGRWMAGREGTVGGERHRYAYFPFGAGPRICIGEQFAWMEGVLLLATIARRWRLRLIPGQRIEPQPIITLRPKYGLRMTIEERSPRRP
jgi:cytochrome P450